jgi:hypothetical protein
MLHNLKQYFKVWKIKQVQVRVRKCVCMVGYPYPTFQNTLTTASQLKHRKHAYLLYLQHEHKSWAEAQQVQACLTNHVQWIQQAHINIISQSWMQCSLNANFYNLYMFMSRLWCTCHLDSCPDKHTYLRAAIGECWGERPQQSTGPLA